MLFGVISIVYLAVYYTYTGEVRAETAVITEEVEQLKSKNEQAHIEREVAHMSRQREIREHTNHASYTDNQRRERDQKELARLGGPTPGVPSSKPSLADRAKYEFEPDDEDDAANDEIDANL